MEENYQITVKGETREYAPETTYGEIAKRYADQYDGDILLAEMDGSLRELSRPVSSSGTLRFITARENVGMETYRRSMIFLMEKIFHDVRESKKDQIHVLFSMDQGFYCEVFRDKELLPLSHGLLRDLSGGMKEAVKLDLPIKKYSVPIDVADGIFKRNGLYDKARLFRYRRSSSVNIYQLDGYEDYNYGYMVPSTGLLRHFSLSPRNNGFLLELPSRDDPGKVDPMDFQPKLFRQLYEASQWAAQMEMATLGELDDKISKGEMDDFVLAQEAVQEQHISNIADMILESGKKKFVLIAGPSSSGKTTFSHRLSIQLYAKGARPHPISLDDFFKNRDEMEVQPDGTLDFEALSAVDVDFFAQCMGRLLNGEAVQMPTFDFRTGRRKFEGGTLQIGKDDILVIEGIHGLNPKLSESLPEESKFRIYLSALTPVKIDEYNRISTRDGRLLRRIVRDARTRGTSAQETLRRWESVRIGEEQHIFPFQENADVMFNSSLVYEIPVLKLYVEPMLFAIPQSAPEYHEAKRLLKMLDYSLPYPSDLVAKNSILREFIGGSCFHV